MSEEVGAGFFGKLVKPIWTREQTLPAILLTGPLRFLDAVASLTNICNEGLSEKNSN